MGTNDEMGRKQHMLGRDADATHLNDLRIEALLGRETIETGAAVSGYRTGKRVLVTGAGGSIGSELCRHIRVCIARGPAQHVPRRDDGYAGTRPADIRDRSDPDVSRFFMSIPEAVRLVVQAGAIGRPSPVLVLDMGSPVRIADLARRLMEFAGSTVYTGLRDGEKLHEDLFADGELDERPFHPLISHMTVSPLWISSPPLITEVGQVAGARDGLTASKPTLVRQRRRSVERALSPGSVG